MTQMVKRHVFLSIFHTRRMLQNGLQRGSSTSGNNSIEYKKYCREKLQLIVSSWRTTLGSKLGIGQHWIIYFDFLTVFMATSSHLPLPHQFPYYDTLIVCKRQESIPNMTSKFFCNWSANPFKTCA